MFLEYPNSPSFLFPAGSRSTFILCSTLIPFSSSRVRPSGYFSGIHLLTPLYNPLDIFSVQFVTLGCKHLILELFLDSVRSFFTNRRCPRHRSRPRDPKRQVRVVFLLSQAPKRARRAASSPSLTSDVPEVVCPVGWFRRPRTAPQHSLVLGLCFPRLLFTLQPDVVSQNRVGNKNASIFIGILLKFKSIYVPDN